MRTYKRPEPPPPDPYQIQPPPVDRPVAVYYRQSSEGQVGNISTTLQTVNMVDHLERLGWLREQIAMIDMDAGFSGQLKISERPGMSQLLDMIERGDIGAVASQEVDRFFRDVTQIQTNIFIDACKRNDVKVLTPTMIYDFAHPIQGRNHMQMFRERAQAAADYLELHIRGRLLNSRHWLEERGMWAGRKIAPGYMVDLRKTLPDGSTNPNWRKFVRFDAYADVVRAYFEAFRIKEGNLKGTWEKLEHEGPFFPEFDEGMIPKGFVYYAHMNQRSRHTGGLVPSMSGLRSLFTNGVYIGHWVHKEAITRWNNHEPIIPLDLFMYAFNRLSPTDFLGEPNPNYAPYRTWIRHNKEERGVEPPTYSGLIFSDNIPGEPHHRLSSVWGTSDKIYKYQLYHKYRSNVWHIQASIVDPIVDGLLLERLEATTIDEDAWQQALDSVKHGEQAENRRIESGIREAQRAQENLIASLTTLNNSEMIRRAEARFEALEREIKMLSAELERFKTDQGHQSALIQARPALEKLIVRWKDVPRQERRSLFEAFAHFIKITRLNTASKKITIYWRDGSQSAQIHVRKSSGYYWEPENLEKLRDMVENDVDQVEILRAFPDYSWRALQERYAYRYGDGRWRKDYAGVRRYPRNIRWEDTEEAQTESSPQPEASSSST
jgi:DNA invertase Pin-like site-specific DNA recombinase